MTDANTQALSASEIAGLRKLLDRQAIADCLARICQGTDRFDRDLFLSGFHPDAQISAFGAAAPAADTYEGGRAAHDETTFGSLHCLSQISCDIQGDTAHTETYYIYHARDRDGTNWAASGRYFDQFERRSGEWKIVFRHLSVEWAGRMTPTANDMFAGLDETARLSPKRNRQDPTYLRPLKA